MMNYNHDSMLSPSVKFNTSSDITPKRKQSLKGPLTPLYPISEENMCQREKKTPLTINPFDVKAESLYFHSCSPFFAKISRNKDNGTFRWSIEQLSVLCPADIDESSLPETCVDPDQEQKAQKAIDTFFSQNSIVPSPWSDCPSSEEKNDVKYRRASRMVFNHIKVDNCDTATQTALSIPPDVDLKSVLGKYFTFNDEEDSFSSRENSREELDPLSASSLRRKLFVTEEECISPTRIENKNIFSARFRSTPTTTSRSTHSTPASDVLSSSPITPPRCSDSCNILSSPPLSPITANYQSTSIQMKSINEQDSSNIFYSPEKSILAVENEMSFLTESQEANPFPSNGSERQDTGYVTGSISSSQNMNFSEMNYGIITRIAPVMELMEECELSNSTNMSCKNICSSIGDSLCFDIQKNLPLTSCNVNSYPWMPASSSTPAQDFHNL